MTLGAKVVRLVKKLCVFANYVKILLLFLHWLSFETKPSQSVYGHYQGQWSPKIYC